MCDKQLLEIRTEGDILVVRLDVVSISAMSEVEHVSQLLRHSVQEHHPKYLVVDFSGVRFFSSQMLGLLVEVWRRLRDSGGSVTITGINPQLTRVFRITNLDKLFSFYETTEQAITAIQTG
jgi:stage II sporulation protein AA (anti-sigma F factor antagonist)